MLKPFRLQSAVTGDIIDADPAAFSDFLVPVNVCQVSLIAIDSVTVLVILRHDDAVVVPEVLERVSEDVGFN